MVLKYATQIAAINAAIAKLDADLANNPQWQALTQKKYLEPDASNGLDPIFAQLRLEQELARDPVYRARVRLLEAVQVLQQILDESDSASAITQDSQNVCSKNTNSATGEQMLGSRIGEDTLVPENGIKDRAELVKASSHETVVAQDDLMRIRGVTRSLNKSLKALGITQFVQIADWTSRDRHKISEQLGLNREISRQNWIEQAALLVAKSVSTPDRRAREQPESKINGVASVGLASQVRTSSPPKPVVISRPTTVPKKVPADLAPVPLAPVPLAPVPSAPVSLAPVPPAPVPVTVHKEVPHVLIRSAAQGLIGRLQASNDTKPDDNISTAQPPTKTETVGPVESARPIPSQDANPLRPQSQIVFSPQIVPEPRRVVADQKRLRDEYVDARARNEFTKPELPKDKLRFGHLKTKLEPTTRAESTETYVHVQAARQPVSTESHQGSERSELENNIQKSTLGTPTQRTSTQSQGLTERGAHTTSPNPLSPPPVPPHRNQASAFKKRRWLRQRALQSPRDGGRANFGDGQLWRQPDQILTGPALNESALSDDAALDPKIYAHTEEASVEIVRTRAIDSPASEPLTDVSPDPQNPDHGLAAADKTVKLSFRHPAKRIFKALKSE